MSIARGRSGGRPLTTFAPSPAVSAANQIQLAQELARRSRAAVDRQQGNPNGGAGKPLTPAHDWSGFEKSFPQGVQPGTTLPVAQNPTDVNSTAIQTMLDNVNGGAKPGPEAAQVAQARATGMPVQTQYGSIGSNWQADVMKNHPEIGIKGSQANADFLDAYKKAQANGGTVDPHLIAQNVMDNIRKPAANPLAPPTGVAGITPDIAAPTGLNPQTPVNFAGSNVGPADWSTADAQPGVGTGQAIRNFFTGGGTPSASDSPQTGEDAARRAASASDLSSFQQNSGSWMPSLPSMDYIKGIVHGVFGGSGSPSSPAPQNPASDWAPQPASFPLTDPIAKGQRPFGLGPDLAAPPSPLNSQPVLASNTDEN